jgi:hypothetical protein
VERNASNGSARLVVDEKKLEEDLKDNQDPNLTLGWSSIVDDQIKTIQVELNSGALKQLTDAKKKVLLKTGTESVLLPAGVLTGESLSGDSTVIFSIVKNNDQLPHKVEMLFLMFMTLLSF